jgi:hypothetical protein
MADQTYQSILVTGINPETGDSGPLFAARQRALDLFETDLVSPLSPIGHNFVQSFCIFPSGSSSGRTAQIQHSIAVNEFVLWLDEVVPGVDYVVTRWSADDKPIVSHSHETRYEVPSVKMPNLQSISNGTIHNRLPFGKKLASASRRILNEVLETVGFGFQDGGCLMFASALKIWSGNKFELASLYVAHDPSLAHHVIAKYGEYYLDSDGIGTADDLIVKLSTFERRSDYYIDVYRPETQGDIPYEQDLVDLLVLRISQKIGPFNPDQLHMPAGPILS